MSHPEPAWKKAERRVAEQFGAHRVPCSGVSPYGKKGDVDLASYLIDVKQGKQIPKKCVDWLEALRDLGKQRDEIPVLVLHPYRAKDDLVILTLDDFVKMRDAEYQRALADVRTQFLGIGRPDGAL